MPGRSHPPLEGEPRERRGRRSLDGILDAALVDHEEDADMAGLLKVGSVHHIRLTVTDVGRSRAFYTEVLGFEVAVDGPPPADDPHHDLAVEVLQRGIVLMNGPMLLGLRPADEGRSAAGERFDPFRVGLDHLSFSVDSRDDLEAAATALDERGLARGELTDLPMFGIAVLPVEDPDGIQLELTAPLS